MNQSNSPLISVIVPVYGTEKYLRKCLDSILTQTYKNIELIVVNDASKDDSENIIKEYLMQDDRVKYVRHSKNKGLFQARISGAEEATGEYIAFVDSDDYISCDYYRMLVKKAEETKSDMVLADFCLENEDGSREYYNLDPIRIQDLDLRGEEVLKAYMEQKGLFYSWQLVWNKLIKIDLWKKCIQSFKALSEEYGKLNTLDQLAVSCKLWMEAEHVVNEHHVLYFSNGKRKYINTYDEEKLSKGLEDTVKVFGYFEKELKENRLLEKYYEALNEWKKYYARIFMEEYKQYEMSEEEIGWIKLLNEQSDNVFALSYDDKFFYQTTTELSDGFSWFEEMKAYIGSDQCEYVSFDIFDTLIVRPFFVPTDLFYEMNDYFTEITGVTSLVNFADIRIECEEKCRENLRMSNPMLEEVTLEQIYEQMQEDYVLENHIVSLLMKKELELEERYCVARNSIKEVYELASFMEKKILITSDMYLPLDTVQKILDKNGYNNNYRIYLSSDIKLGKWSTNLFKYILKDLGIRDKKSICHIGDNWVSDVEHPRKVGMVAFHITKTTDLLQNCNPGIYSGKCFEMCYDKVFGYRDGKDSFWNFVGLRKILAIVANKLFDNPYVSINKASDFNADPYFVGYFPIGMHLFSVLKWLIDELECGNYEKIHFVARDGYILKQIYDIYAKDVEELPKSQYTVFSRKALALLDINCKADFYSLINKLNINKATPKSLCNMFSKVIIENTDIKRMVEDSGFLYEGKFSSRRDWDKFVKWFADNLWDPSKHKVYIQSAQNYFKEFIGKKDAMFDIGYSGRVEAALKSILGYTVDGFYVYSNSEQLNRRMNYSGFHTKLFYDYKPVAGVMIREHVYSQLGPSAIGYDFERKTPVFEPYVMDYQSELITSIVQNAALDLTKDIISIFGNDIKKMYTRYYDLSQPFEYYLHMGKKVDRNIFSSLVFEDDFGEGKVRAVDFWGKSINQYLNSALELEKEEIVINEEDMLYAYNEQSIRLYSKSSSGKKTKKIAMFMDEIKDETISQEEKFSKCVGNTSNLIYWDAIKDILSPQIISSWYMTREGGFETDDYNMYLTTHLVHIEENQDFSYLKDVLKRIGNKPLLPISIGLSASGEKKDFYIHRESLKVLKEIAERCKTVGVRGAYTAEILNQNGIKNVRMIGCPSLYQNMSAMKNINNEKQVISNICVSFKPFYGRFTEKEKKLLSLMAEQGCDLIDTTPLKLSLENIGDINLFENLRKWEENKKILFDVSTWREYLGKYDFVMGMNFHTNVLAMQSGVPAMFITHETSGREMCEFYKLPHIDINNFDSAKSLLDYYVKADYTEFMKHIDVKFQSFVEFLKENGIEYLNLQSRIIER